MDIGRKFDLYELMEARKKAKNSYEYDRYSELMYKLVNENVNIRKYRDMLIKAVRNNDKNAIHYAQHELERIKFDMTYGKGK